MTSILTIDPLVAMTAIPKCIPLTRLRESTTIEGLYISTINMTQKLGIFTIPKTLSAGRLNQADSLPSGAGG